MAKIVEREDGLYEDKGGYFVKIQKEQNELRKYATPSYCPACSKLLMNIDTRWFSKWGVCLDCSISYLEDRKLPANLKDFLDYQAYVKEKISSKEK